MREFVRRSGAALSVLLTGVAVEFILAVVKSEPVSPERFGTLLAIIVVLSVALELAERKRTSWRRIVAAGLIVIGVLGVAAGVLILFNADLTSNQLANVVGTTVIASGVIVVLSGFYVAMQRGVVQRDDPGEYPDLHGGLTQPLPNRAGEATGMLTTFDGDISSSIVDLCRHAMAVRDLHFVGFYVNGKCRFYTDVLDDTSRQMQDMRGDISAEARRRRYEAYGRLAHGMVGRLDSAFAEVEQGNLIRVVLDVEQGAFYYMRVDQRRFIFGVTMNQNAVNIVDDKLRTIAIDVANLSGLLPSGPLRPAPSLPPSDNVVQLSRHPKAEPA